MNSRNRIRIVASFAHAALARAGIAVLSRIRVLPPRGVGTGITLTAVAIALSQTGCTTVDRAKVDATWFTETHSERVIAATTVSAESDRIAGVYPYDLEELVTLAGTEAGFIFADLVPSAPNTGVHGPPLAVDVDIRERSYTHGVSQLQAIVARVRLSSSESTPEDRPLAVALYRADSTESIISYFHVYDVLVEVFKTLRAGTPDSTVYEEAAD